MTIALYDPPGPIARRRVLIGSTADRLIHHATCPVLVVPRTADPAEAELPVTVVPG